MQFDPTTSVGARMVEAISQSGVTVREVDNLRAALEDIELRGPLILLTDVPEHQLTAVDIYDGLVTAIQLLAAATVWSR
jgi:hypothetical protein